MKETIILIPQSSKLSISLAYHNSSLFNTRFFTPVELSKEALLRSGKVCDKSFVSKNEELSYFKKAVENVSYFTNRKLSDIKNISNTITTIRNISEDDSLDAIKEILDKGIFKEKNEALYEVLKNYTELLGSENKTDTIGLIRYALKNSLKVFDEITIIEEYPPTVLGKKLAEALADNVKSISIFDLYGVNKNSVHVDKYLNCYGSSNELAYILDDIYKNHNSDECVIACADYNTYSEILYDYSKEYGMNMTFDGGVSIINSYPGKLLRVYYYWMNEGNYGWKPFMDMLKSPYFNFTLFDTEITGEDELKKNILYDRLSKLRLTENKDINSNRVEEFEKAVERDINDNKTLREYIPYFKKAAEELSLPIEEFIVKYAINRNESKLDESARNIIVNEIKTTKMAGYDTDSDVIEGLLKKMCYRSCSKPGHIHVTSIDKAMGSLRKNLYVCGLSSAVYPGSVKENPLLLDSDLKDFGNDDLSSAGKIKEKRNTLLNLIYLSSALNNRIVLSYPGLNVSELKNNNASSLLYEIYRLEHGNKSLEDFKKEDVEKIAYFEPALSKNREIGKTYNEAKDIVYKAKNSGNKETTCLDIGKYSPSALNNYFSCPKCFFYQNLLKINAEDDYDPYQVIAATEQGTLVHSLMEYLSEHKDISLEEFKKFAGECFDEYLKISVPLIIEKSDTTREQFIEMAENGWKMDHKYPRELLFKEEDRYVKHESGITIHGFPDRVEKMDNGKAVIIDFKTESSRNNHHKDDIDSCLQVVIYAYIVEKTMNVEVDHCEYRILRFEDGIVTCKYDDEIKAQLNEKLMQFKKAIEKADFEIGEMTKEEEKKICRYCRLGSICGKVVKDEQ